MRVELPLEVLSRIGPILCWIEGSVGLRLPQGWIVGHISPEERFRHWLIRELPTYSKDTADDIVRLAHPITLDSEATASRARRQRQGGQGQLLPPAGYDLMTAFDRLCERYFQWHGSELSVHAGQLEELHELALRFPVGHLIRHSHARAVATGLLSEARAMELPEQLNFLQTSSYGLRTVVNRGLTEGHMHLNGVTSGTEAWADQLLRRLTPGIIEGFEPQEERLLILSRAAVRLLALGVLHHSLYLERGMLPWHLITHLDRLYMARGWAEERIVRQSLGHHFQKMIREILCQCDHDGGRPHVDLDWMLRLLDPVAQGLARFNHRGGQGMLGLRHESIHHRMELLEKLHYTVHRLLLQLKTQTATDAGARVLPATNPLGEFMHQVFFRYLVYRTHHWQMATQSGRTTGLREFQRFYDTRMRRPLAVDRFETHGFVWQRLKQATALHIVEGRISPPSRGYADLVPWILGYAEGDDQGQPQKFGLVIHFLKADHKEKPSPSAVFTRSLRVRHGQIRRRTRAQALRLYNLLSLPHPAVPFIVGIDAANLELTTPPEVFAPAFRFLREYPIELRRGPPHLERLGVRRDVSSLLKESHLGMTYHVGEDFLHLLSGLRAIDEVIEFLHPKPGDRLGHAIALAFDPETWARQTGYQAVIPKLEWLDNLAWLHQFLGPGHDLKGELGVEDSIQRLSWQIYGSDSSSEDPSGLHRDWSPLALYDSWRLRQLDPYSVDLYQLPQDKRHDPRPKINLRHPKIGAAYRRWHHVQHKVLEETRRFVGSNAAYHLLGLYWYSPEVHQRGDEVVVIDMQAEKDKWLRLCRDAQVKLREKVQRKQLVVEVNPSSNRLIGPMAKLSDHHIFALTLDEQQKLSREVRVTINTDDPGVFNTSLAHEYYLLGENLIRRGVSEAKVEAWLDWLRTNGLDYTFVRSLPSLGDRRIARLLERLKQLNHSASLRMGGSSRLEEFWQRRQKASRHPNLAGEPFAEPASSARPSSDI